MLTPITRHGFTFQVASPSFDNQLPPLPDPSVDYVPPKAAPRGLKKAEREAMQAEKRARREARIAEANRKREEREKLEIGNPPPEIPEDITTIQGACMSAFGIARGFFFGRTKREPISTCRIISMALCKLKTRHTPEFIAYAHNRERTGVIHAVGRFKAMQGDKTTGPIIAMIEERLECG